MLEEMKRGILAGFGAVVLTREKIESICQRLVEEAKMSKEDAEKLANELYEAGKRQWADLENGLKNSMRSAMEGIDIGSHKELKRLRDRLESIEKRVMLLESVGHVPQRKEGNIQE